MKQLEHLYVHNLFTHNSIDKFDINIMQLKYALAYEYDCNPKANKQTTVSDTWDVSTVEIGILLRSKTKYIEWAHFSGSSYSQP